MSLNLKLLLDNLCALTYILDCALLLVYISIVCLCEILHKIRFMNLTMYGGTYFIYVITYENCRVG